MRAQLLGLLERFDLDFVLTSHELWGCYPELSALGIYHLHREPGHPRRRNRAFPLGRQAAGGGFGSTHESGDHRLPQQAGIAAGYCSPRGSGSSATAVRTAGSS